MASNVINNDVKVFYNAIAEKQIDIIKQCLEDNILMFIKNKCIKPPLHHAVLSGCREIVVLLLNEIDDIDCVDSYGKTALHLAVQNGYADIVQKLLNEGANVNITCKRKKSALSYALDEIGSLRSQLLKKKYLGENDEDDNKTKIAIRKNNLFQKKHYSLYQFVQIAEYLEECIIKFQTMNLYISEQNLQLIEDYRSIEYEEDEYSDMELDVDFVPRNFYKQCENEFIIIKNYKFGVDNISFYDILISDTFNDNQLSNYAKNLFQIDYKVKFRLYAGIIKNRLKRGIERNKLLLQVNQNGKNDYSFFRNLQLNFYCIYEIFKYLNNEDLKNLIEVIRTPSIFNDCKSSLLKENDPIIQIIKQKNENSEKIKRTRISITL
ncbi:putative ankyrin repeat protein RF_0580 [Microplitis mediator]|uniref:putative ankyrin repeat protein RF_0580 n=1 Tax=Microplitis mediator TaxID=375433 RepID=UPI0025524457|nr:putative ankyrin repeat protein RF_0580 [Microplitis mediator]